MRTYKHFTALINYKMSLAQMKNEDAAKALGMCEVTWTKKKINPQKMLLSEVMRVFDVFHFSEEERKAALYDG